jgi:hypothetical protein
VLGHAGGIGYGACEHGGKRLREQRLAQQLDGGGIALLDLFARIEHQDAARQSPHQRRMSRGQVLFAGVCLAQFDAQLRNLIAQCVECPGKLFGNRTEGEEGCLQFGARVAAPFQC